LHWFSLNWARAEAARALERRPPLEGRPASERRASEISGNGSSSSQSDKQTGQWGCWAAACWLQSLGPPPSSPKDEASKCVPAGVQSEFSRLKRQKRSLGGGQLVCVCGWPAQIERRPSSNCSSASHFQHSGGAQNGSLRSWRGAKRAPEERSKWASQDCVRLLANTLRRTLQTSTGHEEGNHPKLERPKDAGQQAPVAYSKCTGEELVVLVAGPSVAQVFGWKSASDACAKLTVGELPVGQLTKYKLALGKLTLAGQPQSQEALFELAEPRPPGGAAPGRRAEADYAESGPNDNDQQQEAAGRARRRPSSRLERQTEAGPPQSRGRPREAGSGDEAAAAWGRLQTEAEKGALTVLVCGPQDGRPDSEPRGRPPVLVVVGQTEPIVWGPIGGAPAVIWADNEQRRASEWRAGELASGDTPSWPALMEVATIWRLDAAGANDPRVADRAPHVAGGRPAPDSASGSSAGQTPAGTRQRTARGTGATSGPDEPMQRGARKQRRRRRRLGGSGGASAGPSLGLGLGDELGQEGRASGEGEGAGLRVRRGAGENNEPNGDNQFHGPPAEGARNKDERPQGQPRGQAREEEHQKEEQARGGEEEEQEHEKQHQAQERQHRERQQQEHQERQEQNPHKEGPRAAASGERRKVGCTLFQGKAYVVYSALGSFYIPALVMLFFYSRIYLVASRAHKAMQRGYMTTKWPPMALGGGGVGGRPGCKLSPGANCSLLGAGRASSGSRGAVAESAGTAVALAATLLHGVHSGGAARRPNCSPSAARRAPSSEPRPSQCNGAAAGAVRAPSFGGDHHFAAGAGNGPQGRELKGAPETGSAGGGWAPMGASQSGANGAPEGARRLDCARPSEARPEAQFAQAGPGKLAMGRRQGVAAATEPLVATDELQQLEGQQPAESYSVQQQTAERVTLRIHRKTQANQAAGQLGGGGLAGETASSKVGPSELRLASVQQQRFEAVGGDAWAAQRETGATGSELGGRQTGREPQGHSLGLAAKAQRQLKGGKGRPCGPEAEGAAGSALVKLSAMEQRRAAVRWPRREEAPKSELGEESGSLGDNCRRKNNNSTSNSLQAERNEGDLKGGSNGAQTAREAQKRARVGQSAAGRAVGAAKVEGRSISAPSGPAPELRGAAGGRSSRGARRRASGPPSWPAGALMSRAANSLRGQAGAAARLSRSRAERATVCREAEQKEKEEAKRDFSEDLGAWEASADWPKCGTESRLTTIGPDEAPGRTGGASGGRAARQCRGCARPGRRRQQRAGREMEPPSGVAGRARRGQQCAVCARGPLFAQNERHHCVRPRRAPKAASEGPSSELDAAGVSCGSAAASERTHAAPKEPRPADRWPGGACGRCARAAPAQGADKHRKGAGRQQAAVQLHGSELGAALEAKLEASASGAGGVQITVTSHGEAGDMWASSDCLEKAPQPQPQTQIQTQAGRGQECQSPLEAELESELGQEPAAETETSHATVVAAGELLNSERSASLAGLSGELEGGVSRADDCEWSGTSSGRARADRSRSCGPAPPCIVVNWEPGGADCPPGGPRSADELWAGPAVRVGGPSAPPTTPNSVSSARSSGAGLSLMAQLPGQVRKQSIALLSTLTSRSTQTLRRLSNVAAHPVDSLLQLSRAKASQSAADTSCSERLASDASHSSLGSLGSRLLAAECASDEGPPQAGRRSVAAGEPARARSAMARKQPAKRGRPRRRQPKRTLDDYLMAVAGIDSSSDELELAYGQASDDDETDSEAAEGAPSESSLGGQAERARPPRRRAGRARRQDSSASSSAGSSASSSWSAASMGLSSMLRRENKTFALVPSITIAEPLERTQLARSGQLDAAQPPLSSRPPSHRSTSGAQLNSRADRAASTRPEVAPALEADEPADSLRQPQGAQTVSETRRSSVQAGAGSGLSTGGGGRPKSSGPEGDAEAARRAAQTGPARPSINEEPRAQAPLALRESKLERGGVAEGPEVRGTTVEEREASEGGLGREGKVLAVAQLEGGERGSQVVCVRRLRGPKRTSRWHAKRLRAETKAAKTVAIIVGGFICCWLPFFTAYLSRAIICSSYVECVPQSLMSLFTWLGYLNSAINPVIYGLFSADFRHAFKHIVCQCRFTRASARNQRRLAGSTAARRARVLVSSARENGRASTTTTTLNITPATSTKRSPADPAGRPLLLERGANNSAQSTL